MKFIWIVTLAICQIYQTECPQGCKTKHEHFSKECRDTLFAFKDRKEVIEFLNTKPQGLKKIDSLQVK